MEMNYHSDEWIMAGVQRHYNEALKYYKPEQIFGIFLFGSQNHNYDSWDSDIDTYCIVFDPTITLNQIMLPGEERIYFLDYIELLARLEGQIVDYFEILDTKYYYVNHQYQNLWDYIKKYRNQILYYHPEVAIEMWEEVFNYCNKVLAGKISVPNHIPIVQRFGYNVKQLSYKYILIEQFERWICLEKTLLLPDGIYVNYIRQGLLSLNELEALSLELDNKFSRLKTKNIKHLLYYNTDIFQRLYKLKPQKFYGDS